MRSTHQDVTEISEEAIYVAGCPVMRQLRTQAELLAKVEVPVLILGESGSGKELTARLIHHLSSRSAMPFVKIRCAALESDGDILGLGAASAGSKASSERLEQFHGTVLFHEITEIPVRAQLKLLTLVQEQLSRTNISGPRILATSAADLPRALAEKRLRDDLYYHLTAFTIQTPPLRERYDELESLVAYFMRRAARRYKLEPRLFSDQLLRSCRDHSWPGNLRELESFVQRHLVIGDDALAVRELRRKSSLPQEGVSDSETTNPSASEPKQGLSGLKTLIRSVKGDAERGAIQSALEQTQWNRKEAARLLGISYRSILYKIEQYHLVPLTPRKEWKPSITRHSSLVPCSSSIRSSR